MHSFIRWFLAAVTPVFILAPTAAFAATGREVRPPFGMVWGLGFQSVEESIKTVGGHVVERLPGGAGVERWSVTGIPQEGLQSAIFTFHHGHLQGVEVQYGSGEWDTPMYEEFMRRARAALDAEYGSGRLLVRQRVPGARVLKTMVGYSWEGGAQSVALIYFAAQDEDNLFRLVSLHYSAKPPRASSVTLRKSP